MFAEILDSIMNKVEGALGAIIMGMDGISIEKRSVDVVTGLEMLSAEFTSLLRSASSATPELEAGPVEELIVATGNRIILVQMITKEYFILAMLSRDGNLGRARFELKKAKYALAKELAF
jgi:predicted regulator of Ras-like GTPase activity (Roadblock/LC7/MglB family)